MTYRDYREIRKGEMLRHPRKWRWGEVLSFAPNGKPHVRLIGGGYQNFPIDSVVCHLYEYDLHIRHWRLLNDLMAFRKRVGRDRLAHAYTLINRQRLAASHQQTPGA